MAFGDASFNRFEREIGDAAQMMRALDANAPVAKCDEVTAQALNALYTSIGQFGGIDLTQKQAILEKAAGVVELARQDLSDDTQKMVGLCKSFIQARRDEVEQTLIASMKNELVKLYPNNLRGPHGSFEGIFDRTKIGEINQKLMDILSTLPQSVRERLERGRDRDVSYALQAFYHNMSHIFTLDFPNKNELIRKGFDFDSTIDPEFRTLRKILTAQLSELTEKILHTKPEDLAYKMKDYTNLRDALLRVEKALQARNSKFDPEKAKEGHIKDGVLFSDDVVAKLAQVECGVMSQEYAEGVLKKCAPDEWLIRYSPTGDMYVRSYKVQPSIVNRTGFMHQPLEDKSEFNELLSGDITKCLTRPRMHKVLGIFTE